MAGKDSKNFSSGGFGWRYILFIITMVMLALILPLLLPEGPPILRQNPLETTGIVVNIMLTSTVIWFYRYSAISNRDQVELQEEVVDLQENQKDIMARQTNLMEANHRTVVEVENHRADKEKLILNLSNYGNSVATNLELVVLTWFEGTDNIQPDITYTGLTRVATDSFRNRQGNAIRAEEEKVSFEARPGIALGEKVPETEKTFTHGFGAGMDRLSEEGIEIAEIYFYIRYQDLLGEYHLNPVFTIEVTPKKEHRDFEQVYRKEGRHPVKFALGGDPQVSPDDLSFDLSEFEIPDERTVV